ncbi:translation initiation factor IF-2 [Alloacidobacterium dinghuense]|uniref:Translation initiation factor IF-2 n=1 Tax=Alloacidobacterium dinghuense TaxID=2763107 RepID=A0A7G8BEG3_9BACT|nr:translation initiation factor IF-2 [Alloacidobacterium dinghuense]QNI30933.1 translation initiation factor IF-2 [Alloacidobacterium dinghuense]
MSKVRINDLARELEVKSKAILDVLTDVGVIEKKTHSSSLEADEAERVRAHFNRGGKTGGTSAAARAEAEAKPKIDWSRVSKPGDVLKAIQQRKEEEALAASRPTPQPPVAKPAAAPVVTPVATNVTPRPPVSQPAPAAPPEAAKPAPRRIVPQPRPAPAVIAPPPPQTPAIAAKPPAGPVVAKPPVAPAVEARPVVAAVPPSVPVAAKPTTPPHVALPQSAPVPPVAPVAAASSTPAPVEPQVQAPVPAPSQVEPTAPSAASASAPVRRVIMPQTGPRPVYTAPPPPPPPPVQASSAPTAQTQGGLQRGRPIFDRRPGGAPGGQRPQGGPPGQFPGGRRPMHPTRTQPGGPPGAARPGFGQRPGFGARPGFGGPRPGMGGAPGGLVPPPGEAPRPQRPGGPQRRGRQQYPKTKEGPMKGFAPPSRFGGAQVPSEPLPITRTITVTEGISVKDLAEKLGVRGKDLIATLLMRGVFVTVNQSLDAELVKDVAHQFGADTQFITFEDQMANEAIESMLQQENPDELEVSRPPVVTVMGHVDHGKTSLLDAIRETDVAGGEAGGITQHIGAYKVRIGKQDSPAFGREIVFLDTPGHEAFTRMRARGAKVTDIVVIVVAADDGVMPQTLEAIDHAKAANVPIIVAVNKIDKPEAQPDRVKKQLGDRGLVPEDWGGSTVFVDVSAKKRQNLDLLLEMICLVADLGNLKATPGRSAVGTVIEAKLDRGRGAVASVLVQNGTLRNQDSFIVGNTFGKIRAMFDDRGRAIEEAGPSTPVEILGLEGMPDAGDTFLVTADRDKAKSIAQYRRMKEREAQLAKSSRVSLEGLAEQIKQAGVKELPLILKGDVTGSVEVLADSLQKMSTEKVRIKVIHSGVGAITESDVLLATASNAIIIGFNVRPERKVADLAEQEGVEIRLHSIIYELQDEIRKAMLGLLEPVFKENYLGRAEVLNVFKIPKVGTIAGCRVTDGVLRRDAEVRLMRDGEQVFKGKLTSLKRFKDDAKEVTNGMECGVGLSNFNDVKVGDTIEAFVTEKVAAELTAS